MDSKAEAKLLRCEAKEALAHHIDVRYIYLDPEQAIEIADLLDPPVQPPENMPKGYKWDGEYRLPKRGEWFIAETNGEAEKASHDWSKDEGERYIIYKIEPKFKSGEIVMLESQIRFVTKDGLRLPDGDLSSAIQDECRPTTNMEIGVYCKEFPESTVAAFRQLAKLYAKEVQ